MKKMYLVELDCGQKGSVWRLYSHLPNLVYFYEVNQDQIYRISVTEVWLDDC